MINNIIKRLYLKNLERKGFKHGKNLDIEKGANIDARFAYLVCCGDNVTLAKDVYILGHDAAMGKFLKRAKIGKVTIGSNVFIGAKSVVLPGISIGDDVIVAANSTITKDIPSGEVWGGNPAHKIMNTNEYLHKHKVRIANGFNNGRYWYGE